jgi:hypothetical protein
MVDLSEAHTLCSKSELNLVESSFAPLLETATLPNLKLKINSIKKLHRKCMDMINLLHSESRITTTRRKLELFAETIGRFEAALNNAEIAQGIEGPAGKHDDGKTVLELAAPGLDAPSEQDRKLEGRESRITSALARRSEQLGQKSGSTRAQSHVGSIPRRQQGRRNSSKNH